MNDQQMLNKLDNVIERLKEVERANDREDRTALINPALWLLNQLYTQIQSDQLYQTVNED